MHVNPALVIEFDRLTAPLMVARLDLPRTIQRLEEAANTAVRSLLGWSLAITVNLADVTLTSMGPRVTAADIRASLRIPLTAFLTAGPAGSVVFYAAAPHAFIRLAANFTPTVGPAECVLHIDQDLNPDLTTGLTGVRQMATINRAIDTMINQGETPEHARQHLQAMARLANTTLHQSAELMLSNY
jgi:hypothetical protein